MMDELRDMLEGNYFASGDYYLLDAGTYPQDTEDQEKPTERPIILLSELDSDNNYVYNKYSPENPQFKNNFKIGVVHDFLEEDEPEEIGELNDSTFYHVDETSRENFRTIRFMYLEYNPDDEMLDQAVEIIKEN